MPEKGFFVITDITGYTAFLTGSELDHAQDILKSLFDTLLDTIRPPLIVSNFQGDAILTYAPDGSVLLGQTLLETVESVYCAYAHQLELMQLNTTCTCRACANIPNLDLKMFIHYGEYALQNMRGRTELSGPDVILVHRMMKNSVVEQTGHKAYALLTETAVKQLGMEDFAAQLEPHQEHYEYLGDVPMAVYDLRAMWEQERERRRTAVQPEEAWLSLEVSIAAPPSLVWSYLTEPEHRRQAMGVKGLSVSGTHHGRTGVGSTFHCAHGGENTTDFFVVDWRPFEYMTEDVSGLPFGIRGRITTRLTPAEGGGTRLDLLVGDLHGASVRGRLLLSLMRPLFKRSLARDYRRVFETLGQNIEADRAAGRVKVICVPAAEAAPAG